MKRFFSVLCTLLLCIPAFFAVMAETADDLFSDKDLTLADPSEAVDIVLTEGGVDITEPGVYRLSGQVADGSIRVAPATEGDVWLLLDGVSVHNEDGAALTSDGCDKLILTLAEGSVNSLTQGSATPAEEDNDAAIYVRDDLTINGNGALTIESAWLDGINCRDSLRIVSGDITVSAVDDGLVGKDEVTIGGGTITISAQTGDGIKATNAEDADRGFVAIAGGTLTITTGEGSASVSQTASDGWGSRGGWEQQAEEDTPSQKGVKAETTLTLSGGTLSIDSVDDALHAVDVTVSGGEMTLATGDDGVHADNALTVSGGTITVTRSYEGLEGTDVTLSGGEISITASDDGINGAGGDSATSSDEGTFGASGRFGRDRFASSTGTVCISGGMISVSASGDGVDVNGDLEMTGGELYVNGPESGGDGALDYDGSFTLTGGTVVAVGSAGMAQGVSDPSIPGTVMNASGSGVLEVLDSAGNVLIHFETLHAYSHAVLYSDRFTDGETYTVTMGGNSQSVQMTTDSTGGMGFGGGRGGFGGGRRETPEAMPEGGSGERPAREPGTAPESAPPEGESGSGEEKL